LADRFQHSITTLIIDDRQDIKTVQQTLRHANSKITMDICAPAVDDKIRQAHERMFDTFNPLTVDPKLVRPLDPDLQWIWL
jgi:integrase